MKKTYFVKNTPHSLPISKTAMWTFFMYYFNAPSWLWGVYITLGSILWIIFFIGVLNQEGVDIFEDIPPDNLKPKVKSLFQERLEKMAK
jgi:hypothetical protein